MTTCSKCGAGNRPDTEACRMCGNPLDQSGAAGTGAGIEQNALFATVTFPNLRTRQGSARLGQGLVCPDCYTINQVAWTFCPQCGRKIDSSFLESILSPDQVLTVEQAKLPDNNHEQVASDPPPISPQPPEQPRQSPPDPRTRQPRIRAFEQPAREPVGYADDSARNQEVTFKPRPQRPSTTGLEGSFICPECGYENSAESFFCSSCGLGIPVAKTVIMSSISTPPKTHLRLLVEPGEQGPIYEINDELTIGRIRGNVTFPNDNYMSNSHARIERRGKDFILVDDDSSNGVFVKMKREMKLSPGDIILIGRQLFKFEA